MIIRVKTSYYCPFWREENKGDYRCNVSLDGEGLCPKGHLSEFESAECPLVEEGEIVVVLAGRNEYNTGRREIIDE